MIDSRMRIDAVYVAWCSGDASSIELANAMRHYWPEVNRTLQQLARASSERAATLEKAATEIDQLAQDYDEHTAHADRSGPSSPAYVDDRTWYGWIGAAGAYRRSAAIVRSMLKKAALTSGARSEPSESASSPDTGSAEADVIERCAKVCDGGTGIGAIPATTDYANGWNDCRKEAFEMKKGLAAAIRALAQQSASRSEE